MTPRMFVIVNSKGELRRYIAEEDYAKSIFTMAELETHLKHYPLYLDEQISEIKVVKTYATAEELFK
jgi:hypothetical protein